MRCDPKQFGIGPLIKINQLHFHYGNRGFAVRIDRFEITSGEKIAIVGPSGSGKTTLLDLLAGIRAPASGEIIFNDVNLHQLNDSQKRKFRASKIGLVFQEFELVEYLTVRDNILLPYLINKQIERPEKINERVTELARSVGIEDKLSRKPLRLSQGEKQRVAICRALIHQPDLVLADEPTGNLDAANKQKIISLLIDQAEREMSTLIVVTHDQSLIDRFDRVVDVSEFGS